MTLQLVTFQRVAAWSKDKAGGRRPTYAAATTTPIACSVQPTGALTSETTAGREMQVFTYNVYFHDDPQLNVRDRILWGARILTVTGAPASSAGQSRSWVVECTERPTT